MALRAPVSIRDAQAAMIPASTQAAGSSLPTMYSGRRKRMGSQDWSFVVSLTNRDHSRSEKRVWLDGINIRCHVRHTRYVFHKVHELIFFPSWIYSTLDMNMTTLGANFESRSLYAG